MKHILISALFFVSTPVLSADVPLINCLIDNVTVRVTPVGDDQVAVKFGDRQAIIMLANVTEKYLGIEENNANGQILLVYEWATDKAVLKIANKGKEPVYANGYCRIN